MRFERALSSAVTAQWRCPAILKWTSRSTGLANDSLARDIGEDIANVLRSAPVAARTCTVRTELEVQVRHPFAH
jgi:hypothetical protein